MLVGGGGSQHLWTSLVRSQEGVDKIFLYFGGSVVAFEGLFTYSLKGRWFGEGHKAVRVPVVGALCTYLMIAAQSLIRVWPDAFVSTFYLFNW